MQLCWSELVPLWRPKVLMVSLAAVNNVNEDLPPEIVMRQIQGGLARRSYGVEYARVKLQVAAVIFMTAKS